MQSGRGATTARHLPPGSTSIPAIPTRARSWDTHPQRHGLERATRDAREHSDLRRRVDELEAERAGMSVSDYHADLDHADRVLRHGD